MAVAGSIVVTTTRVSDLTQYTIAWTSSAGGAVSENTFACKVGELVQVGFTPDGGGTQPSDLYDLTLLDADGADVLGGAGANLSNANPTKIVPVVSTYFRPFLQTATLAPTIANAGNAKKGTITLLVR